MTRGHSDPLDPHPMYRVPEGAPAPGQDAPAAALAIGLFFLAGAVLLAMPWLMNSGRPFRPAPPMQVGPEPPVEEPRALATDPAAPVAPPGGASQPTEESGSDDDGDAVPEPAPRTPR